MNSITSPRDSIIDSVTLSIASSAPLVPRSTRCLADEEADFVAAVVSAKCCTYHSQLDEGEIENKRGGPSNGIVVTQAKPIQLSAYDFKSGRQE